MSPHLTVGPLLFIYDRREAGPRLDTNELWPVCDPSDGSLMGHWWSGNVQCAACGLSYIAVAQLYVVERTHPLTGLVCGLCGEKKVKVPA